MAKSDPLELKKRGCLSEEGYYLAQNLLEILKHAGGRVKLISDAQGKITHTFQADCDDTSLVEIPYGYCCSEKQCLYPEKKECITEFLVKLGLNANEAKNVLSCLDICD